MSVFLNPYRFSASGPSTTIQYVGGMTAKNAAGADFSATLTGNLTGGIAASPAAGDLVIVSFGWSCAFSTSNSFTGGSDTSVVGNQSGSYSKTSGSVRWGNSTSDVVFGLFYHFMGATPDGSLSLNWHNQTSDGCVAAIQVWRAVDTTTPLEVVSSMAEINNTGQPNPPSITPLSSGAVILAAGCGAQSTGGSAFGVPSGMSNGVTDFAAGSSRGLGAFLASTIWDGVNPYDPAAATGGSGSGFSTIAQTIALKPA